MLPSVSLSCPSVSRAYMGVPGHCLHSPRPVTPRSSSPTVRSQTAHPSMLGQGLISYAVDKSSRPLWAVVATLLFAPIAYVDVSSSSSVVCESPASLGELRLTNICSRLVDCHLRIIRSLYVGLYLCLPVCREQFFVSLFISLMPNQYSFPEGVGCTRTFA